MNLNRKKELTAKTLKVGKNRICFNIDGISEIKEAITKQDIKELYKEGVITIKPVCGRKKIKRRKTKKGPGKIKKKLNKRKQIYVKITRKLRGYLKKLKEQGKLKRELYLDLRKKIRMRFFKSKAHLKGYLNELDEFTGFITKIPSTKKEKLKNKKKTNKNIKRKNENK